MPPSFHIPFLMKMITDRVDALITKELAAQHITAAQGRVLAYVTAHDGEHTTQGDIERYLGVSHTTAKGLIERLEAKSMLQTAFDNEDKRVKSVYLTDRSRAIHREIESHIASIENILLAGLSPSERTTLSGLMRRLYANIQ